MKRLVIHTQNGKTIQFENVTEINERSGTLFFKVKGYAGDEGTSMFKNHCGYTTYENKK